MVNQARNALTAVALILVAACVGGDEPQVAGRSPRQELSLRGMYVRDGGVSRFTECETGITYPIAPEGNLESVEAAYQEVRAASDEPLLVSFRGRIEPRRGSDGVERDAVVIGAFEAIHINDVCEGVPVDRPLEGTNWEAYTLMGSNAPEQDRPSLFLDSELGLRGWSGCRPVEGVYTLRGAQLRFGALERPEIPCLANNRFEQLYMGVLQSTGSFEMSADTLRLVGEAGVLAVFTAG